MDVVSVCKLRQPILQASILLLVVRPKYLDNTFLLEGHWDTGCQCKKRTLVSAYGNKNIGMKLMVTDLSKSISVCVRNDRWCISRLFSLGNKT